MYVLVWQVSISIYYVGRADIIVKFIYDLRGLVDGGGGPNMAIRAETRSMGSSSMSETVATTVTMTIKNKTVRGILEKKNF